MSKSTLNFVALSFDFSNLINVNILEQWELEPALHDAHMAYNPTVIDSDLTSDLLPTLRFFWFDRL